MDEKVKALIGVYARHSISEINNPETGGPLLTTGLNVNFMELIKAPWYINNREIIETFKAEIEDIQKTATGSKEEVKKCLSRIRTRSFTNIIEKSQFAYRMELYRELVLASFKDSWSQAQLNYFSTLSEKFCTYNTYFLSYTNHSASKINTQYKPVYTGVLNKEDLDNLEDKNLLAKTLVYHLQQRNLKRGFFDVDSIHKGEQIDPALDHHVTRTFAFVQLISLASFENRDPNYSFYEFQKYYKVNCTASGSPEFNETSKKMLYFLVLEDTFPEEDLTPPEYLSWLNMAKDVNHWKVYECSNSDAFANIAGKLVKEIMFRTGELIDAAPDH
jgi:hypothetical protein